MTYQDDRFQTAIGTIATHAVLWKLAPDKTHPIGGARLLFNNREARDSALNILRAYFQYEAYEAERPLNPRKDLTLYPIDISNNTKAIETLEQVIPESRIVIPKLNGETGVKCNHAPSSAAIYTAASNLPDGFHARSVV